MMQMLQLHYAIRAPGGIIEVHLAKCFARAGLGYWCGYHSPLTSACRAPGLQEALALLMGRGILGLLLYPQMFAMCSVGLTQTYREP